MFDNLREQADNVPPFADDHTSGKVTGLEKSGPRPAQNGRLFGMTPGQRLIIALLLMVVTCVLGLMCLLLTGRIGVF